MRVSQNSIFTKYELTEDETLNAHIFTDLQVAAIQNLLAEAAEDLVNIPLEVDDSTPEGRNKRAYTQGMVAAYKYLLEVHDANKTMLNALQNPNSQDQGE